MNEDARPDPAEVGMPEPAQENPTATVSDDSAADQQIAEDLDAVTEALVALDRDDLARAEELADSLSEPAATDEE